MSKQHSIDEVELSHLHQSDKERLSMPASIKQKTLRAAHTDNYAPLSKLPLWNWLVGVSATAATVVLVTLLAIQSPFLHAPLDSHFVSIEYHGYDQLPSNAEPQQLISYQAFHQLMEAHQAELSNLRKILATVHASDQGLALRTCENHQLMLSERLVNQMKKYQRIGQSVEQDTLVTVQMDQQGHILLIETTIDECPYVQAS